MSLALNHQNNHELEGDLKKEHKKFYNLDSCFLRDIQDWKDISLFKAVRRCPIILVSKPLGPLFK